MSNIDEMMKLYKEIQENYIKALERENEELRKRREKDSLRIEELEKEILIERGNKYIKNVPNPVDDKTVIGPGNGWGYPHNPIWTTTSNTIPATYQAGVANAPTSIGNPTNSSQDTMHSLRQAYHNMMNSITNQSTIDFGEEYKKMAEYQRMLSKIDLKVEDDN